MRRPTQRIVLVSLIAVAALVALYPRVPAPPPLFPKAPAPARPAPTTPVPTPLPPPGPILDGPKMPTYRPPAGSMERMPVAGSTPMGPRELPVQPPVPRPGPGPTY